MTANLYTNLTIGGETVTLTNRRYGRASFTWAHITDPVTGAIISLGDPWNRRPSHAELRREIERVKERGYADHNIRLNELEGA